jgi:hypothetical protein
VGVQPLAIHWGDPPSWAWPEHVQLGYGLGRLMFQRMAFSLDSQDLIVFGLEHIELVLQLGDRPGLKEVVMCLGD